MKTKYLLGIFTIGMFFIFMFILLGCVNAQSDDIRNTIENTQAMIVNYNETLPLIEELEENKVFLTSSKEDEEQKEKSLYVKNIEILTAIVGDTISKKISILNEDYVYRKIINRNIDLSKELQEFTYEICEENNISYDMVLGVFFRESRFKIDAISGNGVDRGIAQLSSTYEEYHASLIGLTVDEFDYLNPYHNIEASIKVLLECKSYWEDKVLDEDMAFFMLNTYNMGLGNFNEYLDCNGMISRDYDEKVMSYKEMLEQFGTIKE